MSSNITTSNDDVNTSVADLLTDPNKILELIDALTEENVHINPVYIKIAGSITGGYYLTQLMFLSRAFKHQEFFKTDKFFQDKYGFTEWELRIHREKLIELNFISTRRGQGGKLLYTVNRINIYQAIHVFGYFNSEETAESIPRKPRNQFRGNRGTLLSNNKYNNDLDNKPPNPHPQSKVNGSVCVSEVEKDFDKFWNAYPVKVGKKVTQKTFSKIKIPTDKLISALNAQLEERENKMSLNLFCPEMPHPSTWLNNERWDDETKSLEELKKIPKQKGNSSAERASVANKIAKDDMEEFAQRIRSKRQGGPNVRLD